MPKTRGPRLLAAFEREPAPGPQAELRSVLLRAADTRVLVAKSGRDAASFADNVRRAAVEFDPALIALCDGPLARAAIARLNAEKFKIPTVLTTLGLDVEPENLARPGRGLRGAANVAEIWGFGPERLETAPADLLPGGYHHAPRPTVAWVKRRLRALLRAPGRAERRALTSIIIPCWNGLKETRRCLKHIRQWTTLPHEVIVVDNGSVDATARHILAQRAPNIRLIRNKSNRGFAHAINQGLAAARGTYCVWLNNDCFVTPNWLELMIDALERAPWIGAVGPFTNETTGIQKIASDSYPGLPHLTRFSQAWSLSRRRRMAWTHRLTGFCVLHRKSLIGRIGGLDERFGSGCYEDLDFCLRVRQAGFEMYVAEDVFVHHEGHAAFRGNGIDFAAHSRGNRNVFIDKWCRKSLEFLDELDPVLGSPPLRRRKGGLQGA